MVMMKRVWLTRRNVTKKRGSHLERGGEVMSEEGMRTGVAW